VMRLYFSLYMNSEVLGVQNNVFLQDNFYASFY